MLHLQLVRSLAPQKVERRSRLDSAEQQPQLQRLVTHFDEGLFLAHSVERVLLQADRQRTALHHLHHRLAFRLEARLLHHALELELWGWGQSHG